MGFCPCKAQNPQAEACATKGAISAAPSATNSQTHPYSAFSHAVTISRPAPHPKERFLIIDIGGGSAEIILSENERMVKAFSKPLGALRLQELFLRTDPPRTADLHRLDEYIEERIGSAVRRDPILDARSRPKRYER